MTNGAQSPSADASDAEHDVARWEDMPDRLPAGAIEEEAQKLTKWDLRRIRTRKSILHAGRELFADRGVREPRVEDVARVAGVSRAAFYLHFRSLDELIGAVFDREIRWQLRRYRGLSAEILASERRMRGWLERFFASFRAERGYMLIIYRALSSNPAYLEVIYREHERLIGRLGRRIPELGVFDASGGLVLERALRLHQFTRRLEEMSLYSAFDSWGGSFDLALDLITRDFVVFAAEAGVAANISHDT